MVFGDYLNNRPAIQKVSSFRETFIARNSTTELLIHWKTIWVLLMESAMLEVVEMTLKYKWMTSQHNLNQ